MELESDGRVRIFIGSIDMGQGTDTAMGLIAAGELALPLAAVSVVSGDTNLTPDTGASPGSRVIYTDGNAVMEAAVRLREAILSTASGLMDISYESLELRDALVVPREETGFRPTVSLADVARARQSAGLPLRFKGNFHPIPMRDSLSGAPSPYLVYVSATHMAEVEVDMEQGAVRVLRVVAAHDVGRVIYAQGLKGQIEGAVSMGMGFALKEEFHPGETTGFKQYRLPTARETPEIISLMVELVDPSAGLGAKGAAECATVAVAPAIANAIADATGTRIHHLPATPPRLLALIGGARLNAKVPVPEGPVFARPGPINDRADHRGRRPPPILCPPPIAPIPLPIPLPSRYPSVRARVGGRRAFARVTRHKDVSPPWPWCPCQRCVASRTPRCASRSVPSCRAGAWRTICVRSAAMVSLLPNGGERCHAVSDRE